MTAGNNIQFRWTPEVGAVLPELQRVTGLDQTNVIRLAIMEMAERRGVSLEVKAPKPGAKAKTKGTKKR